MYLAFRSIARLPDYITGNDMHWMQQAQAGSRLEGTPLRSSWMAVDEDNHEESLKNSEALGRHASRRQRQGMAIVSLSEPSREREVEVPINPGVIPPGNKSNGRDLHLLSIGGGGINGMSALIILKNVLRQYQSARKLPQLPRPCDVFDLVGGTGTGGIIAVMLFRLGMTIDNAITAFTKLSEDVFTKKHIIWSNNISRLENAFAKVIQSSLNVGESQAQELRMLNDDGPKCFVSASTEWNMPRVHTYVSPHHASYNYTIVEAITATTGGDSFLPDIDIGDTNLKGTFIQGGSWSNDPVRAVLEEAMSIFPGHRISCVLSIGGRVQAKYATPTSFERFRQLISSSDSVGVAKELSDKGVFYCQLDMDLQDIAFQDWERLGDVTTLTQEYLAKPFVTQMVDRLVFVLDQHTANASAFEKSLYILGKFLDGLISMLHGESRSTVISEFIQAVREPSKAATETPHMQCALGQASLNSRTDLTDLSDELKSNIRKFLEGLNKIFQDSPGQGNAQEGPITFAHTNAQQFWAQDHIAGNNMIHDIQTSILKDDLMKKAFNRLEQQSATAQRSQLLIGVPCQSLCGSQYTTFMDSFYTVILLAAVPDDDDGWFGLYQIVVGTIITLQHALPCVALSALLDIDPYHLIRALSHLHSLISLIDPDLTFRIHHESFTDFVTSASRCDRRFLIDLTTHHLGLGKHCLEIVDSHLKRNMRSTDQFKNNEGILHRILHYIPQEVTYALIHWATHLAKASTLDAEAERLLEHFAHKHFLIWLEIVGIFGQLETACSNLERILDVSRMVAVTREILHYGCRFIASNVAVSNGSACHLLSASALGVGPWNSLHEGIKEINSEALSGFGEDRSTTSITDQAGGVTFITCSVDGMKLASASYGGTMRLWDGTGVELAVLEGHLGSVNSLLFSPDGTKLASASGDETVRLWDVQTAAEIVVLRGHAGSVNTVVFSPDGRKIATASSDETVRLWDSRLGKEVNILRGHSGSVESVVFSPNGTALASTSLDGTVRLWDSQTGALITVLLSDPVGPVVFSPDGTKLAFGSYDGMVRLWDCKTGDEIASLVGSPFLVFILDSSELLSISVEELCRLPGISIVSDAMRVPGSNLWVTRVRRKQPPLEGFMVVKVDVKGFLHIMPLCWFPPELPVTRVAVSLSRIVVGCADGHISLLDITEP